MMSAAAVLSSAGRIRPAGPHPDRLSRLMPQGDFHSINGIDGGVASRSATQGGHARVGDKPHVHKVILNRLRQIQSYQYAAIADVQFAQHAQTLDSHGLPKGPRPKCTTRIVGFKYTTNLV